MTLMEEKKHEATYKLNPDSGVVSSSGAINAVLVAMLLFEPGTMRINDAEQKLPSWLLPLPADLCSAPGSVG